ncbi:hypothetical protein [Azospirillum canadense]|uniref:hypothetical protein n=1 Tax=Azospirillum canadense TaxID=403962 RepID=UPI002226FA36|nr:hypothetical protein [Azospirillum canadense]MCW2239209.1 hypothetical protein [Azospirillum canadense]
MFTVSEEERAAISRAYEDGGEWAAVAELRRYFAIEDNDNALFAVRSIVRWRAAPVSPPPRRPPNGASR